MRIADEREQEPFRSRLPAWGLAVYALAVVAGGPTVVAAKKLAPAAETPLRVALAALALVAIGLLARDHRGRGLLAIAALAAASRVLMAAGFFAPGRVAGSLIEGAEMATVALALAVRVPPRHPRTHRALIALAAGALGLKLAWAFELLPLVRWGGLALLPLAIGALVGFVRATAQRG